jgi:hypothetical protein
MLLPLSTSVSSPDRSTSVADTVGRDERKKFRMLNDLGPGDLVFGFGLGLGLAFDGISHACRPLKGEMITGT